mmetsp:Transcript_6924/g.16801  ORF Transcript_6924/g.16801 Transcript_6924/m.16801 type:complete len:239 (-) Transcript_6924:161-877(-)
MVGTELEEAAGVFGDHCYHCVHYHRLDDRPESCRGAGHIQGMGSGQSCNGHTGLHGRLHGLHSGFHSRIHTHTRRRLYLCMCVREWSRDGCRHRRCACGCVCGGAAGLLLRPIPLQELGAGPHGQIQSHAGHRQGLRNTGVEAQYPAAAVPRGAILGVQLHYGRHTDSVQRLRHRHPRHYTGHSSLCVHRCHPRLRRRVQRQGGGLWPLVSVGVPGRRAGRHLHCRIHRHMVCPQGSA